MTNDTHKALPTPSSGERMEATQVGGIMLTRHPLLRAVYNLAGIIEECGASTRLTDASCAAFALLEPINALLDEIGRAATTREAVAPVASEPPGRIPKPTPWPAPPELVTVPKEPSPEMIEAAHKDAERWSGEDDYPMERIYRTMCDRALATPPSASAIVESGAAHPQSAVEQEHGAAVKWQWRIKGSDEWLECRRGFHDSLYFNPAEHEVRALYARPASAIVEGALKWNTGPRPEYDWGPAADRMVANERVAQARRDALLDAALMVDKRAGVGVDDRAITLRCAAQEIRAAALASPPAATEQSDREAG